ncbi:MAG: threonine ammonia-lyase [Methanoregulaceae archaeon]|nr:threonine ammonia-lyase [Methanoregulaceae archaeon]
MVSLADIRDAAAAIKDHVIRTPLVYSPTFSEITGAEVYLKLEALQKAGSFKVRGATNRIIACRQEIKEMGVIAASAGNHAQGVAVAGRMAGVLVTIVMPEWVSLSKQEATVGYGARVILKGETLEESIGHACDLAKNEGYTFIHPYDDPAVIAGQGTVGLEIMEDLPGADHVIVPVGGGGLIAGIATAAKAIRPSVQVTGVQATACPSAVAALTQGKPVTVASGPTIADGIRVKRTGGIAFPVIRDLVDRVVLVDEVETRKAVVLLLERKKILSEGAGAVSLAALLEGRVPVRRGEKVVAVISGGNVDPFLLERLLRAGLFDSGRIMHCSVILEDESLTLSGLVGLLGEEGATVTRLDPVRAEPGLPLHQVRVALELEIRGPDHRERILASLREKGFRTVLPGSWAGRF